MSYLHQIKHLDGLLVVGTQRNKVTLVPTFEAVGSQVQI